MCIVEEMNLLRNRSNNALQWHFGTTDLGRILLLHNNEITTQHSKLKSVHLLHYVNTISSHNALHPHRNYNTLIILFDI